MRLSVSATRQMAAIKWSPAMAATIQMVDEFARHDLPILLSGETGTGKGLLAKRIHQSSPRSTRAMVEIDCSAIPAELLESELFGHERGAFTGAVAQRAGRFEAAHEGTLFLDEVNSIPISQQAKLLKALEDGVVTRVGSSLPVEIDIRVVAATGEDLERMITRGEFREDLYHRLAVAVITVPPLRQRRSEIPQFARHFLNQCSIRDIGLSKDALAYLDGREWPGNVRQLRNIVLQGAVLAYSARREEIIPEDLHRPSQQATGRGEGERGVWIPFGRTLKGATDEVVKMTLDGCSGNVAHAARVLNVTRPTLYRNGIPK